MMDKEAELRKMELAAEYSVGVGLAGGGLQVCFRRKKDGAAPASPTEPIGGANEHANAAPNILLA